MNVVVKHQHANVLTRRKEQEADEKAVENVAGLEEEPHSTPARLVCDNEGDGRNGHDEQGEIPPRSPALRGLERIAPHSLDLHDDVIEVMEGGWAGSEKEMRKKWGERGREQLVTIETRLIKNIHSDVPRDQTPFDTQWKWR